jgi:hypothetical protein
MAVNQSGDKVQIRRSAGKTVEHQGATLSNCSSRAACERFEFRMGVSIHISRAEPVPATEWRLPEAEEAHGVAKAPSRRHGRRKDDQNTPKMTN